MPQNDSNLLFPPRAIPTLRGLRGEAWRNLIDQIMEQEPTSLDRGAFVLMMVRLGGCSTCQADSFRAMRGCIQCSSQTIHRFRGTDEELIKLFNEARSDIDRYNESKV